MSQLRAKQVFFANQGELLVGGAGNKGVYLPKGGAGTMLRVIDGALTWNNLDQLLSADGKTKVTVSNGNINLALDNGTTASALSITNTTDSVNIAATGSAKNIHIVPQVGGEVFIGAGNGGVIQADDGQDLVIMGGQGAGNLFLMHGGSGKLFYATDASDPLKEVATLGDVKNSVQNKVGHRLEFAGDASAFTLPADTVVSSVEVFANGLVLKSNSYAIDATSKAATFDASKVGYAFDGLDTIVFIYNLA